MNENKILELLSSWNFWGSGINIGIERNISNKIVEYIEGINKIIVLYGIRRSGKSYILRQIAKKLSDKYGKNNILYVNFEESGFVEKLNLEFLNKIYYIYKDYVKPNIKPVIILDEVQEIEGWERFVRSLNEKNEAIIILSGSSAKLLSKEISTILSGRTINFEIFSLSFQEFLVFKNFNNLLNLNKLKELLREYINFGGFPEVVLENNKEKRSEILINYYNTIVIKDVALRYKLKNIENLNFLSKFIISNVGNYITYNSLEKKYGIPVKTAQRYLEYLNDVRLYLYLNNFSFKLKEINKSPKKIYTIDTGFYTSLGYKVLPDNIGKLMENIVAIELFRRKSYYNKNLEIYYFKDYQQHEIDFLIKEGNNIKQLIQVSYINNYDEIDKREIRSLLKGYNLFKEYNPELLIITWDYEDTKVIDNVNIKFVPLYKWLLSV
ncbi:AAA+ superfamily ATPase [Nanobdella aerobiophila]|uniref:AAA+ superfamily ATPase n=1 Tax=Nanobdella aerobiophila TaxID=2586965 RepID=A0A915WSP0_9ARCH|nr:ATP-binding protein [Nanobdella aerobiophila]BBL45520.1 AAA+ superfamily ATPase [Nanobdella aerobiophila]